MRKRYAAVWATASLAVGCGAGERAPKITGSSELDRTYTNTTPQPPANAQPQKKAQTDKRKFNVPLKHFEFTTKEKRRMERDPVYDLLMRFRQKIIGERKAAVANDICVVWSNLENGITATKNPGAVGKTLENGKTYSFPIFTNTDLSSPYVLTPMNGPLTTLTKEGELVGGGDQIVIPSRPDSMVKIETSDLSQQPVQDAAGRVYFTKAGTNEPVILTERFPVSFSQKNAEAACTALENHTEFISDAASAPTSSS